jgi:hypothetical protein
MHISRTRKNRQKGYRFGRELELCFYLTTEKNCSPGDISRRCWVQAIMVTPSYACRLATTVARGLLSIVLAHKPVIELCVSFIEPSKGLMSTDPSSTLFHQPLSTQRIPEILRRSNQLSACAAVPARAIYEMCRGMSILSFSP